MNVAYDTETTGLDRRTCRMFSFSVSNEEGHSDVYRLDGSPVRAVTNQLELKKLWKNSGSENITKVMHNAKFDMGFTKNFLGMSIQELEKHQIHDTSLMSRILQNDHQNHRLKELAWELGGFPRDDEKAIKKYTKTESYQSVPEPLMTQYQHRDAQRTMLLFLFMWPKIQENKDTLEIYKDGELALVLPTMAMEDRGVMINRDECVKLITKLQTEINKSMDIIEEILGERTNPNQQAYRNLFYKKLSIDPNTRQKTETGLPKLEKEDVLALREQYGINQHPLIENHIQYKSYVHGLAIIKSYLELADSNDCLHPNINTCAAITGRESCENPNLQNVAKERVLLNPYPVAARYCFRPRPGYVNFHLDYSGIEMRLLIHYSGDEELVKIACEGGDVHLPATLIFFGDAYTNADKKTQKSLRDASKNTNFAKPYGANVEKCSKTLNLSIRETSQRMAIYEARFPKLSHLNRIIAQQIRNHGYVNTTFNRKMNVPKEYAYMGLNYMIQGTAAEILKRAQPRVYYYLQKATGNEMQMLLPIHDELIIECPRKYLKDAREVLQNVCKLMTDFPGRFRVPLEVEVDVTTASWAQKHKYTLKEE